MKTGLLFRDFSGKKNPVGLFEACVKVPKTFRQISESRQRKQRQQIRSKNLSVIVGSKNTKEKQKKAGRLDELGRVATSRSPDAEERRKQNIEQENLIKSQIQQKHQKQKGLKFNPNKKPKKHLEEHSRIIKRSILIKENGQLTNNSVEELVLTSNDYSEVLFDMSPTLRR